MRILGIDVGDKNIGLALSDELGWTAQALATVRADGQENAMGAVARVIQENGVSEIVVGMPVNMNGSKGPASKKVDLFLKELKSKTSLPIKAWDERLTSVQAQRLMIEGNVSRNKRRKKVDALAAQLILQNYLDAKSEKENV